MNRLSLTLKCLVISILLVACGDSNDPSPDLGKVEADPVKTDRGVVTGPSVSQSVDASGGTVTSADGLLTVSIPAGALSTARVITIEPITNHVSLAVGGGYRLGPEGTTFSQPVTLTFKYNDVMLGGKPAETLWITTQNTDGSWSANIRSVVDEATKTVTAKTTHFSDWALGRFIDFGIAPQSHTLMVKASVSLALVGFAHSEDSPDDLVPLTPIVDDGLEPLTPLTPIPPVASRLVQFRVKNWSLNGANAPVSNSNGSLNANGNAARYTAPDKRPAGGTVAVTAELETTNKEGNKQKLMVVSNITIIDSEYYLRVTLDGTDHVYIQYGFNGSVPSGDAFGIVNGAFADGNLFGIAAGYSSSGNVTNIFLANFENPGVGTRSVSCTNNPDAHGDEVAFTYSPTTGGLSNAYERKWRENDTCKNEGLCASFTRTFTVYENKAMGDVEGTFSGVLYDIPTDDECTTAAYHTVSGEFRLVRAQ